MDKQILILEMTSYCNNYCSHCLRDGMNKENYSMKYGEILKVLDEVEVFSKNFENFEVKLSGGESTIWKDGSYNIINVIEACKIRKLIPALVTNGIVFKDKKYTDNFFEELKQKYEGILKIYVTIDEYHNNYESQYENKILDNLLTYNDMIELYVQSTVNKMGNNISVEFIKKYSEKNVKFIMNPLLPWGRGINLKDEVPYLILNDTSKETLGEYKKYFYILGLSKKIWKSYDEFERYSNLDVIKELNHCGKTITYMEEKYYYCMPQSGNEDFCFAKIGELDYEKYNDFVKNNEWIQKMKSNDIQTNIEKCCMGYGLCDLCRESYRRD